MKPREIFLNACQRFAEEFAVHGFKPLQKGSLLRRTATDKDMLHEIYFSTSHLNSGSHLENNGTRFNQWTEDSLDPASFMICFAEKESTETFLKNFIQTSSYGKKIRKFYEELPKIDKKQIDLNRADFVGAIVLKLAFLHDMKI
jgi:hypothetical protein